VVAGFLNPRAFQAAVAGGRIFRGDWVYSAATNQKAWYSAHASAVRSATATDAYAFEGGELLAWNAATGASRWTVPIGCSSTSQPAVSADLIVVRMRRPAGVQPQQRHLALDVRADPGQ
jgi:hypothetical protein